MPEMSSPDASGGSASALSPAHVGGRRRGRSSKKLRVVKKSTVRRMLKKQGLKMRGGGDASVPAADGSGPVAEGGRRRRGRSGKSTKRRRGRSLGRMFGL